MKFCAIFCVFFLFDLTVKAKVLELDERFLKAKENGAWLVMFYAPWCGHCKSLEPTWVELGKDMQNINPNVNVARLDATKYSSVSQRFGVQGFPTIKFFNKNKEFEYRGPRGKEDIIAFVNRAEGPATSTLNDEASLAIARSKHDLFYLYVGNDEDPLRKIYNDVADKLMTTLDFYAMDELKMSKNLPVSAVPTVLVFKDGTYYEMSFPAVHATFAKLHLWVMSEQLQSYNPLNANTYGKLRQAGKRFAIAVLPKDSLGELHETMKKIALARIKPLHQKFTFAWVQGDKIPNSLTYATVKVPNILVFDTTNYEYFVLNDGDNSSDLSESSVVAFLKDVAEGRISSKGGSGVMQQLKRVFKDIFNMIFKLFQDSPIIGSLVIGGPILLISLLCYCICTIDDSYKENEYDSEDEEEIRAEDLENYDGDSQDEREKDSHSQDEGEGSQHESEHSQDSQAEDDGTRTVRKRKLTKKSPKQDKSDDADDDKSQQSQSEEEDENNKEDDKDK